MSLLPKEMLKSALSRFQLDSPWVSCDPYGCGHINNTQLVVTESGHRYILQKISEQAFKDIAGLMENIQGVTEHLRTKAEDPTHVLTLIPTVDNKCYCQTEDGFWRLYDFVEHTVCLQAPEWENDFYESAVAFGQFQQQLADFPVEKLHETIPHFHDTPDRYRIFHEVLQRDPMGRAKDVREEIDFVLQREEEAGTIQRMLASGELPQRVTHNDTKLNNVLLNEDTHKPMCVIDLDTVMPGSSLFDYGDSIRFGAATAPEDERDLTKMTMSLDRFRSYTRGFLKACPGLTETEVRLMPVGAKTMTLECGLRFLTDYLDGDHYFAVHREGHNLDRARTQFKLVRDMEEKWCEMEKIVKEERS